MSITIIPWLLLLPGKILSLLFFNFITVCVLVWGFSPSTALNHSEDDVHLPSEALLREYILMDYGFVYKGHKRFITAWPWNYGQVTLSPEGGPGAGLLRQRLAPKALLTKVRMCSAGPISHPVRGQGRRGDTFPF